MIKCSSCGYLNEDDSLFCEECGAKLVITCPNCGAELKPGKKFCTKCGFKLETTGGVAIGDKNVIAGDVIGTKEETKYYGTVNNTTTTTTTIHNNIDETRKVFECAICGKHVRSEEGFTCQECNQFVCKTCYSQEERMCLSCSKQYKENRKRRYLQELDRVYADDVVSPEERKELISLQQELKLSDDEARQMEYQKVHSINAYTELLSTDKYLLDEASYILIEKSDLNRCLNMVYDLFNRYPFNPDVAELFFLSSLESGTSDPKVFENVINYDLPVKSYVVLKVLMNNNAQLYVLENYLNHMLSIWADNPYTKLTQILFAHEAYMKFKKANYLDLIEDSLLYFSNHQEDSVSFKYCKKQIQPYINLLYGENEKERLDDLDISDIKKSANAGKLWANQCLGYAYWNSLIKIDNQYKNAFNCYLKASETNQPKIQCQIGKMYSEGKGIEKNDEEAVKWLLKSAKQGDDEAQYQLGLHYYDGLGIEQNINESFRLFELSAKHGNVKAQNKLGDCYRDGVGTKINYEKSVEYYSLAADNGDVDALNKLGVRLMKGQGIDKNKEKAFELMLKAAEQGHPKAQHNVAVLYLGKDDFAHAVKWHTKAAQQGYVESQLSLGDMFGSPRDEKNFDISQAKKWYLEAARNGETEAYNSLGRLFLQYPKDNPDYSEAIKYFNIGIENGNLDSKYELSKMYLKGLGVDQNPNKGLELLREIADKDTDEYTSERAKKKLAELYSFGIDGVEKNRIEAIKWIRLLADQGNYSYQQKLADCYLRGDGVDRNIEEALRWLYKAAESGSSEAKIALGDLFFYGKEIDRNFEEAVKWYLEAVDRDRLGEAKNKLGDCYFYGLGVRKDLTEAFNWYLKAAELIVSRYSREDGDTTKKTKFRSNNPEASLKVGDCYKYGFGVEQNEVTASEWYKSAFERLHSRSNFHSRYNTEQTQDLIGLCYEEGKGTNPDFDEAFKHYSESAEKGYDYAQYHLGLCYEYGKGVAADYSEALNLFKKSADQGNPFAQTHLGKIEYNQGNYPEALELLKAACDFNNAEAQYYMGKCYLNGEGVAPDLVKAVDFFRKAAEQNNAAAQFYLGKCYDDGTGVKQSHKEAASLYSSAIDNGNKEAYFRLGEMFIKGDGVKKDCLKALELFKKAEEYGNFDSNPDILVTLADNCKENNYFSDALHFYSIGAEAGNSHAMQMMGYCYYHGIGTEPDYELASKWFKTAEEFGTFDIDSSVLNKLGGCYLTGKGVKKNASEAVYWYTKASELGNAVAQFNLGDCYSKGNGVESNLSESFSWFKKSAQNGNVDAQKKLAECYYYGLGTDKNYDLASKWFTSVVNQNKGTPDPIIMRDLGDYHLSIGNTDKAKAKFWYNQAADAGNADSQYKLGLLITDGTFSSNKKEAIKRLEQASEQDHCDAQLLLASLYLEGGDPDKYIDAVKLLQKSLANGNKEASKHLGDCYYQGKGVPKDLEKALSYYSNQYDSIDPEAQYYLGRCLIEGKGVNRNTKMGIELLGLSAESGNSNAQNLLAIQHYKNRDFKKAVAFLLASAEQGNQEAQVNLAKCYLDGNGVNKNPEEAVKWFTQAAEQGNLRAQIELGNISFFTKDLNSAVKWFTEAAIKGNTEAQIKLGDIFRSGGKGVEKDIIEAEKWYSLAAKNGDAEAKKRLDSFSFFEKKKIASGKK